jgi:hypothetical protein
MRLDTSRLDARIRKLQTLKELLSDPEMVTACMEMISGNGRTPLEPAKTQAKNTPGKRAETKRGELMEVAKKIADEIPGKFRSRDLLNKIKGNGYQFSAKKDDVAVAAVLKRLVKHGFLRKSGTRGKTQFEVARS